jgi:hypothetical protein
MFTTLRLPAGKRSENAARFSSGTQISWNLQVFRIKKKFLRFPEFAVAAPGGLRFDHRVGR